MNQFLYYRPGTERVTSLEQITELKLRYAFESPPKCRGTQQGPDGAVGQTFAVSEERLGYYRERQMWRRIPGSPCWVGHYKDALPTPADLARHDQLDGHWVESEDGQRWLIPCARRWTEQADSILPRVALPGRFSLGEDGTWLLGGVTRRYEPLWQLTQAYEQAELDAIQNSDESVVYFEFPELHHLAVLAVQANYRIGPAELDLLGVYDEQTRQNIVDAVIDRKTWLDWAKKKLAGDLAGANSCSGPEQPNTDEKIDTSPAAQT